MSAFDDFIYRVRTGRLFAGLQKREKTEQSDSSTMTTGTALYSEMQKKIDDLIFQIKELETKLMNKDANSEIEEMKEEFSQQIMVLETKLTAFKEMDGESGRAEVSRTETAEEGIVDEAKTPDEKNSAQSVEIQKPVSEPAVKKQTGPDVVIQFIFMDKMYIVENFNLNFRQDVNALKNRPDSFTYGGIMQLTLSGFLDAELTGWTAQPYQVRDGEIRFFRNMPKITDSALLSISFSDAYCTACKKTMDTATSGILTTLTVASRKIKIGNEEFENKWKVKEPLQFTIKSESVD
jgi:hypothetical protein